MLAHLAGAIIRRERVAKGWSQAKLAQAAQVSRTVLSRLEQGTATAVQTDVLDRLFAALDLQPELVGAPVPVQSLKGLLQSSEAPVTLGEIQAAIAGGAKAGSA